MTETTGLRIGHGYDAHRFVDPAQDSRPLVLGGITIPDHAGLLAHSDGDAIIHALCDALLGAVGEVDIGQHFPDNDPQFEAADSAGLLQRVQTLLAGDGWQLINADITVLAQTPRMAPHREAMCERLAGVLGCQRDQINIKASTTEKMGFVGRREGIAVHAVVLVQR